MSYTDKAQGVFDEIKKALQTVYDSLNQGHQKKLLKNEEVKALFERCGVETGETT